MSERVMTAVRRKGNALFEEKRWEGALACYAELVRLDPSDYQARVRASRCLLKLGERERAVTAYHAAAESLLSKGFLLSAIVACKEALAIHSGEKRIKDTLLRIHGRASVTSKGRCPAPPPLPPDPLVEEGDLWTALMGLSGHQLVEKAMVVLASSSGGDERRDGSLFPLPLLADLDREAFIEVVERMELLELDGGEWLIEQGEDGDSIYFICAGGARVIRDEDSSPTLLAHIQGGTLVGEMALLTDAPRSASVITDRPSEVLRMSRLLVQEIASKYPEVPRQLVAFCKRRLLSNLLTTSPLFEPFADDDRRALLGKFESRVYKPGNRIIEEGKEGDGLFVILTGEVQVTKKAADGDTVVLASLREGEVFGEIGLIRDTPAIATVSPVRRTAVLLLSADDFADVVSEPRNARVREYLQGLTEARLKKAEEALFVQAEALSDEDIVV